MDGSRIGYAPIMADAWVECKTRLIAKRENLSCRDMKMDWDKYVWDCLKYLIHFFFFSECSFLCLTNRRQMLLFTRLLDDSFTWNSVEDDVLNGTPYTYGITRTHIPHKRVLQLEGEFWLCEKKHVVQHGFTLSSKHNKVDGCHVFGRTSVKSSQPPVCVTAAWNMHSVLSCTLKNDVVAERGKKKKKKRSQGTSIKWSAPRDSAYYNYFRYAFDHDQVRS